MSRQPAPIRRHSKLRHAVIAVAAIALLSTLAASGQALATDEETASAPSFSMPVLDSGSDD